MLVSKLTSEQDKPQCQYPKAKLKDIGYKGYREQRVKYNHMNPDYCMRLSAYYVNGQCYCSRHAGTIVLEELCK